MNEFDIGLLRKAVEWVETEAAKPFWDREWYQGTWRQTRPYAKKACGTTYCVAGYICEVTGGQWLSDTAHSRIHAVLAPEPGEPEYGYGYDADDEVGMVNAAERARRKLGVDTIYDLFLPCTTAQEVREIAEKIARDHGEKL